MSAVPKRLDLGGATIARIFLATLGAGFLVVSTWLFLPAEARRPGLPWLQLTGIAAALLLTAPFAFSAVKRGGLTANPPLWFSIHAAAAAVGVVLATVHSAGRLLSPPGILLLATAILVAQGSWMRRHLSRRLAQVFGASHQSFALVADPARRATLKALIGEKQALLQRLAPAENEALFSPALRHWLRSPLLSIRYARLARRERDLTSHGRPLPWTLRWARRLHIAVALILLGGLATHIAAATLFAGYVAGDGPVYWWHLADWGRPR